MYDQKFFSVSENNLTKLLMILDHQEIRYKIEDDVDDKIANLKIDDLEVRTGKLFNISFVIQTIITSS
jgi:hypothetical protein